MEPGYELDLLVAKVMGDDLKHELTESVIEGATYCRNCSYVQAYGPTDSPRKYEDPCAKRYSTDIKEAWKVVEKLQSITPMGDIHIEFIHKKWSVSSCYETGDWKDWASGQTAPHAICLAALQAFKAFNKISKD